MGRLDGQVALRRQSAPSRCEESRRYMMLKLTGELKSGILSQSDRAQP